jgi:hypothetical protein
MPVVAVWDHAVGMTHRTTTANSIVCNKVLRQQYKNPVLRDDVHAMVNLQQCFDSENVNFLSVHKSFV